MPNVCIKGYNWAESVKQKSNTMTKQTFIEIIQKANPLNFYDLWKISDLKSIDYIDIIRGRKMGMNTMRCYKLDDSKAYVYFDYDSPLRQIKKGIITGLPIIKFD